MVAPKIPNLEYIGRSVASQLPLHAIAFLFAAFLSLGAIEIFFVYIIIAIPWAAVDEKYLKEWRKNALRNSG